MQRAAGRARANRGFAVASALAAPICLACVAVPLTAAAPETQPAAPLPAVAGPATRPAGEAKPETKPAEAEPVKPQRRPPPESFLRNRRQQREAARNANSGLKDFSETVGLRGPCRLDTLLQFRMVKNQVEVDTASVPAAEQLRVRVEGSNANWTIYRQPQSFNVFFPGAPNFTSPATTMVTRNDPDAKDDAEVWSTYINVSGNNFWVIGQSVLGQVMYNQANGQVNANVTEWSSGPAPQNAIQANVPLNAHASSLGQLRGEHPEEFRKYVLPLLAKLSDLQWMQPGAADVYATFPQIPADEQVTAKVRALLPDLDSDGFPVRDAASARLEALGAPGVLAALRMDWSGLSDEQRGRLLAMVNAHHRRDYPDVAAARRDPNFLADCLEYDDPAVRSAAKAALEQLLGQPVRFDPSLSGPARELAVDAVRKQIAETPPAAPATQPSTQPAGGDGGDDKVKGEEVTR